MKIFYTTRFDLSGLPHYVPEQQVSGTLRIYGNNYISDSPLGAWWMDGFRKHQPGITFDNYLKSAAIALPGLYFGLADLGLNHQPSFYDLLGYLRIHGSEPLEITAVTGSYDVPGWQNTIVIMVHKDNPISKITMKQLDGVFGSARDGGWSGTTWRPEFARGPEGDIRTWGQLGLTGEWANRRITPYGYSLRYATALEFSDKVLQSGDKWNGDLHAYGNLRRKDGTTYLEADQVIDNLRKDPRGIAYLRFHQDFPPELKVLALADGKGGPYVDFTLENVQNRTYPLYGEQNFYASVKPGARVDPKVREFLRYVLSQEAQEMVQRDGKYLPLTAAVVRAQLKKLE
jgi:phosphate transport system substrate-binding protein